MLLNMKCLTNLIFMLNGRKYKQCYRIVTHNK